MWLLKGFWTCHPKKCHFGVIILRRRNLKNNGYRGRLSLNFPHLPKDRAFKRNSIIINPLPGIDSYHWEETRSQLNTQTNFVTNYHISYLFFNSPFIFTKNNLLSPKLPISSASSVKDGI